MKCQRHRLRSRDCAAGILANNFNVGECVSSIDEKEQHSTATQKYDISKDRLTMSAMLQSLFADKLVHDDREPIAILGQYAVFAPDFRLWMQLFVVCPLLLCMNAQTCKSMPCRQRPYIFLFS
jgi:hypothetical protein